MAAPRLTLPQALAAEMWEEAQPLLRARPRPRRPALVVFCGTPLSGKTTLARTLEVRATTATFGVENDEVRARVARRLRKDAPDHGSRENFFTYRTAWLLVQAALAAGANVIHDATNLVESARRGAYAAADAVGASCVVVLVRAAPEVVAARAAGQEADRQAAHARLGRRRVNESAVTRPLVVIDGARPVGENADLLAGRPDLLPLFEAR
ncbi:MAG TPA: AAA family ATPase [Candidatus Thermoplasmatota archaeon]|nr:AAA family ATPase [Candidatus Thermoplasmatota archaeon]